MSPHVLPDPGVKDARSKTIGDGLTTGRAYLTEYKLLCTADGIT